MLHLMHVAGRLRTLQLLQLPDTDWERSSTVYKAHSHTLSHLKAAAGSYSGVTACTSESYVWASFRPGHQ